MKRVLAGLAVLATLLLALFVVVAVLPIIRSASRRRSPSGPSTPSDATAEAEEFIRCRAITASISSRIAAAVGVRRAGSFTSALSTRSDTSWGMAALSWDGFGAGSRTIALSVAEGRMAASAFAGSGRK